MFSADRLAASTYLNSVYTLINNIRYQRQPFTSLRILIGGDMASEQAMSTLCVLDSRVPTFQKEWAKFFNDCANQVVGRSSNPGIP
jgi:hypothetical protein